MKQQAKSPAPEPALTFRTNIMFRDEAENKSIFLEAGAPSPWRDISDVPSPLQPLVGVPDFSTPPPSTENQHWVPREMMEMERDMYRKLSEGEGDNLDPAIRAELAARDAEHLALSESRNAVFAEIADRQDAAVDRVAKELTEETDRLISKGKNHDHKAA